ncbi:MAG: DUF711 family protein [Bacteroidales bacterium]|nr:DUF711 family protein [Bacteroidales bacterium]
MIIRSITGGFNFNNQDKSYIENKIIRFFDSSNNHFRNNDIKVRTNRLNLPSFSVNDINDVEKVKSTIKWVSAFSNYNGIRWLCLPISTMNINTNYPHIIHDTTLEIVKRYKNVFINFIVADNDMISNEGIKIVSKFIKSSSILSNNGYDNFRIGASFNVKPNSPFFPFTFNDGYDNFSLALELVSLFQDIALKNMDLLEFRENVINSLLPKIKKINKLCLEIEHKTIMRFAGIDLSLAPFPDNDKNSVAKLIELLGADSFGSNGTLFLTAFLTDIIKEIIYKSGIRSIGFNGVMYSLLEDTRLSKANNTKEYSIDSLISYSTVCGCGIDMVPVPGNIFDDEITSIMLDIAAISCKIKKPLGVRILPIPEKHENEFTDFSYDFLSNTRIKNIKNQTFSGENFPDNFSFLSDK